MKKRGLAGLLALALILALAACGGTEAQEDAAQDQKMEEAAPPQEEETSETDGEDGVPVTIEGPETADDSQQLQEDEPDLGSRPADPAKEPETGSRPADPAEKPIYQPVEDTKPQQPDKEPETPAQPAPAPPVESASGVDLADFCASVTGDQETWPALMAVEGETLDTFYAGLSAIATQQCLVQMAMISASGDEIAPGRGGEQRRCPGGEGHLPGPNRLSGGGRHKPRRCLVPRAHGDVAERVPDCLQWQLCDAGGAHRRGRGGGAVQRPVRLSGVPQCGKRSRTF